MTQVQLFYSGNSVYLHHRDRPSTSAVIKKRPLARSGRRTSLSTP